MLDSQTKRKIDAARDILVGVVPVPQSQVEQITIALIYKFMDDMDIEAIELGGKPSYFTGDYAKYAWSKLFDPKLSGEGRVLLYQDALARIPHNNLIPTLFRDIFRNAYLPYRSAETLRLFLKCINDFSYDHSEKLGDAFEYLLAVLGSQGDAGQFRTPRHIIDFMVELIDPQKEESILDPACGTAGFLISAYKHIIKTNSSNYDKDHDPHTFESHGIPLSQLVLQNVKRYSGDLLTPDQRVFIHKSIKGYDISPEMVRLSLVNMYLHGFNTPEIFPYDTLTQDERWYEYFNVILANPPFMTPKGGIRPHQKFTIKAKRSEVLFVDYIMEHLTNNGKAGIVVPEGIIFKSENAYKQLRKSLVEDNYLVGVISLPGGVFNPYSGVKTSILWIDKALAKKTDKIIFLKVNADGFDLGAQRRPCDANDLPAAFANAQAFKKAILSGKEYNVPESDVIVVEKKKLGKSGDYNLSGERYVIESQKSSNWEMVELGQLVDIISGGTPDSGTSDYWDGAINWVTLVDLPSSDFVSIIQGTSRKITDFGLANSSAKLLPVNSVLVSSRATIGRVAINKIPLATNQGFKNLIIRDPDILDFRYLAYIMWSMRAKLISLGTGGTYKEVSKSTFSSLQIPLPPLSVQKEIVAELDSYKKIIDGAKQVVDNWKPHIDIDPEWPNIKLLDICKLARGVTYNKRDEVSVEGFPVLRANNIDLTGNLNLDDIKQVSSFLKFRDDQLLKKNDIFICLASGSKQHVGKACFIAEDTDFYFGGFMGAVRVTSSNIEPKYLYLMIMNDRFNQYLRKRISGANINNLSASILYEYRIPLPDVSIQQSIVNRIESEQKLVDANRELINLFEQKIKDRIDRLWK